MMHGLLLTRLARRGLWGPRGDGAPEPEPLFEVTINSSCRKQEMSFLLFLIKHLKYTDQIFCLCSSHVSVSLLNFCWFYCFTAFSEAGPAYLILFSFIHQHVREWQTSLKPWIIQSSNLKMSSRKGHYWIHGSAMAGHWKAVRLPSWLWLSQSCGFNCSLLAVLNWCSSFSL